jgi:hypothetical protein
MFCMHICNQGMLYLRGTVGQTSFGLEPFGRQTFDRQNLTFDRLSVVCTVSIYIARRSNLLVGQMSVGKMFFGEKTWNTSHGSLSRSTTQRSLIAAKQL